MATTQPASPNAPTATEPDWPAQAADAIVDQVGKIRDRTTGPAIKFSGYVVFGAFATLLGTVAFLLFVIGAVRLLDVYLPDAVFGETHMWAAYTILGTIFLLAGLLTSRKMRAGGRT